MVEDGTQDYDGVRKEKDSQVSLGFYNVERRTDEVIMVCQRDITTICDALANYADVLDEQLNFEGGCLDYCGKMRYESMRDRCRNISDMLQKETGYDRNAALEKCRKKAAEGHLDRGIGEDALVLSARKGAAGQKREEANETKTNE